VADAAGNDPVCIFSGEFLAIGRWGRWVWRTICIAFKSNGGRGDGRKQGELLFEFLVLRFAFSQRDPKAIIVNHYGYVIRIVEGCGGPIECGIVEVSLGRSNLPDELGEVVPVFVVAGTSALGGEVELIPPLELNHWRQRRFIALRTADQITAH